MKTAARSADNLDNLASALCIFPVLSQWILKRHDRNLLSRVDHFSCFVKDLSVRGCPASLRPSVLSPVSLQQWRKCPREGRQPPGVHRPYFEIHCFMCIFFFFLWWQPAGCHYWWPSTLLWEAPPLLAAPSSRMGWGSSSCLAQDSMLLGLVFQSLRNDFESWLYHTLVLYLWMSCQPSPGLNFLRKIRGLNPMNPRHFQFLDFMVLIYVNTCQDILRMPSCPSPHKSDCTFVSLEAIIDRFWEKRSIWKIQMTAIDFLIMQWIFSSWDCWEIPKIPDLKKKN